jgi:hypothetical protein
MNKRDDTLHIRMDASDRAILDALASKAGEDLGLDLTNSDLIRLAVRRLPTSPFELFKPPAISAASR